MSTDEHNNASINLDTSELKELEGLENEGEIDQETLNLKLLYKSQYILHKNQESQKTYNCIPSRLELTNRTPVKNKEQAEIHQNQSKNLDETI